MTTARLAPLAAIRRALSRSTTPEPPPQPPERQNGRRDPEAAEALGRAREALTDARLGHAEITVLAGRLKDQREMNHFATQVYEAMRRRK